MQMIRTRQSCPKGQAKRPPNLNHAPRGTASWEYALIPLVLLMALALWELVVRWGHYPAFTLPTPRRVAVRFLEAWREGSLQRPWARKWPGCQSPPDLGHPESGHVGQRGDCGGHNVTLWRTTPPSGWAPPFGGCADGSSDRGRP